MNRDKWTFPYPADKLLEAATTKKAFHEQRLQWWTDKRKEVEDKIKAEGIEIDDTIAEQVGKFSTGYRGPQVQIRNDLVKDLEECVQKINEHRAHIKGYDAWMQVLASQGQATFMLNQDDWLFFFGK